ncbi:glycoside hydrolase family 30 protein [Aquirufa antheringensis]|uniref:glycoside hydrolase family 30 protein n=1 Tax=Aquirufa antheringensis TaxID=2516559 RepID=UPI001F1CBE34|nr:glycoside hydrolase family 30 beta sandwich domain-containing protein [Aquirufa antheringensis]
MKKLVLLLSLPLFCFSQAELYLSQPKQKSFFQKTENLYSDFSGAKITVHPEQTFQSIDGFGFTLTGGSAQLIQQLEPTKKAALLQELFGPNGISVLRIGVGATDLDATVFSYEDKPKKFSLEPSKADLIPVLQQIIAINPAIKLMATPWSPPTWMKDNGESKGGSLLEKHYITYANYLANYIQAMEKEGIPIWALTPQNEPLHPGNNPSMYMSSQMQANFIKTALGPVFKKRKITTKIIVYDHNCDHPEYAIDLLNNADAKQYVSGSAFHLYNGDISALSKVKAAHPDKDLYFTEQWTGYKGDFTGDFMWHVKNVILGAVNNHAKTAIEWNLANDPSYGPHTPGGCTECLGALTISGQDIIRNQSYYIVMQAARFVPAGSIRLGIDVPEGIQAAAFKRPDGKTVLLVQNEGRKKNLSIEKLNLEIPAESVLTIIL